MKKVVTFCGAGGVGKTSVLDGVRARFPGDKIHIVGSIVRQFYADRGVATEAAFWDLPEVERHDFQSALMVAYLGHLEAEVARATAPIVLCDRSIYDHLGYCLYHGSLQITRASWDETIHTLIRRFEALMPAVVYFPLPSWWSEKTASDGFRRNTFGKEIVIDATMAQLVRQHHGGPDVVMPSAASIDERVDRLMTVLHAQPEMAR
jgi:AAA domain